MNDQTPGPKPGWGYGAYAPPGASSGPPSVILWYRIFVLVLAVFYGASFGRGAVLERAHPTDAFVLILSLGTLLTLGYVAAAFIPVTPRGWTLGLVAIAFGLASCFFPAAAFLLVVWCRPVTKAAFQRV